MKRLLAALLLATHALLAHFPGQNVYSATRCYTLLEELGSGAYGVVYSAEDQDNNEFAIKVYTEQDSLGIPLGDMNREFKNGQLFDHPRILKSHELFSSEEENYLSLDLIKGSSLGNTKQQLSPIQTLEEMVALCDAILYSLQKGYLHIDLHTGNIMLNEEGEIMIIDLASFFSFDELTAPANYSHFQQGAHQKLQQFFKQHPTFKQDIDNICSELKKHPALWRILKLLNPLASQNIWKKLFVEEFGDINFHCHLSFYFYNVVSISTEILNVSTMEEEQKEVLISEMNALRDEYAVEEKEAEAGAKIGPYIEKLKVLLEDHLARDGTLKETSADQ